MAYAPTDEEERCARAQTDETLNDEDFVLLEPQVARAKRGRRAAEAVQSKDNRKPSTRAYTSRTDEHGWPEDDVDVSETKHDDRDENSSKRRHLEARETGVGMTWKQPSKQVPTVITHELRTSGVEPSTSSLAPQPLTLRAKAIEFETPSAPSKLLPQVASGPDGSRLNSSIEHIHPCSASSKTVKASKWAAYRNTDDDENAE